MYNHQSESKFLASAPPLLTSWLKEEGSLTDRLNQMTHAAQLHVVHQEWIRAGWWEKYVLHYQGRASIIESTFISRAQSASSI